MHTRFWFKKKKLERNRRLGKPTRRWEGNIKLDLQEIG
jgi:hypothetical protein